MMNNIFRKVSLFTVVLSSCLMMQSCLEEELPKDYATGSQVQGSETAQPASGRRHRRGGRHPAVGYGAGRLRWLLFL